MNNRESNASKEVQAVYEQLLEAWNNQDARGMSDLFTEDGESIGFDGSQSIGREEIFSHLNPIFEHHQTAQFVSKVKSVKFFNSDIALLRAIAGMVPPQSNDINPQVNTHHTLILVKKEETWRIQLFQNTPAQFHGTPELVEQMTEELRAVLRSSK
ncbi:SgcJ/EcaC family oxidoreductase [Bacillus thermocopriae]|uniref:SgcJ/EcaC family oxidoreductase n=1 Tax=Neobacillus thermocopriae TaxID=1215031 RepID=A0A6B3TLQ1_9BACI|nr:SgcJ/EcaC family oxidoreductase [Neobacillus thermocopriae]MED3625427.1 SgcJ/EcaC family oxidoreductase [Neobacillus thermocopriae]MED3714852.1 SgcJ/EcaC family oxidoreductase [Neobacillus thermocopriae]NEX77875.1 SgcJ/EcaC family oxidoreductase [Neobacillus thermocopriae]